MAADAALRLSCRCLFSRRVESRQGKSRAQPRATQGLGNRREVHGQEGSGEEVDGRQRGGDGWSDGRSGGRLGRSVRGVWLQRV